MLKLLKEFFKKEEVLEQDITVKFKKLYNTYKTSETIVRDGMVLNAVVIKRM